MKKRIVATLTVVFILVGLAACGSSDVPEPGGSRSLAADGKTLIDEEAGIRYTFDFSDPLPFELYTAEKMM